METLILVQFPLVEGKEIFMLKEEFKQVCHKLSLGHGKIKTWSNLKRHFRFYHK